MKAYQLTAATGPDALRQVELPEPKAARTQVLVLVRATSLNYRDLMVATGLYGEVKLPLIPLSADQTVLLLGTGGVSIFALQIAKMHGARVIITPGSDEKLARARKLGADETINCRSTPDWEEEVFRLTDKAGVDQVVEVGGTGTFVKSLRSVAPGGQVHLVGGVSGFTSEVPLTEIIRKLVVVRGIYVGSRAMFEAMHHAIKLHQTKPVVDQVFGFADAPAAYKYQQSGRHFGKVVISI